MGRRASDSKPRSGGVGGHLAGRVLEPPRARPAVDREPAAMDTQITEAYRQFADLKERIARDADLAENAVLGPLRATRAASLDRIKNAVGRVSGNQPQGLDGLAGCGLRADDRSAGDVLRLPEPLGPQEHRQRQPPHPCGVRAGRRALSGRLQGRPAAGTATGVRRARPRRHSSRSAMGPSCAVLPAPGSRLPHGNRATRHPWRARRSDHRIIRSFS